MQLGTDDRIDRVRQRTSARTRRRWRRFPSTCFPSRMATSWSSFATAGTSVAGALDRRRPPVARRGEGRGAEVLDARRRRLVRARHGRRALRRAGPAGVPRVVSRSRRVRALCRQATAHGTGVGGRRGMGRVGRSDARVSVGRRPPRRQRMPTSINCRLRRRRSAHTTETGRRSGATA